MLLRNEAELLEARVDLEQKEREANGADRLHSQRMLSVEESEKAESLRANGRRAGGGTRGRRRATRANVHEIEETIKTMYPFAPFDGTVVESTARRAR